VTSLLPWGSLLRAFALPHVEALRGVRRLCRPGAALDIVIALHEERDATEQARLGLPELSECHLTCDLPAPYRDAGFRIGSIERVTRAELRALPSTWAKRLAFGRERAVWRVHARAL
jgi:16S rRNA (adenine(1408)-N(1))-methyltransferase